jgi:hypothetical protein
LSSTSLTVSSTFVSPWSRGPFLGAQLATFHQFGPERHQTILGAIRHQLKHATFYKIFLLTFIIRVPKS